MKKILIACTGFKDVLTPAQVCKSLSSGLKLLDSDLQVKSLPLSDGGEGFLSSLQSAFDQSVFEIVTLTVTGPLGTLIEGECGIIHDNNTRVGVIELARFSGIEKVPEDQRNPYFTTSHGTGQAIQMLYDRGIREIYLGLGGSATTDGGLSVLYALEGLNFDLTQPAPRFITGNDLKSVGKVSVNPNSSMLEDLKLTIACDVSNPMIGMNGSTYVFGPQKGIRPEMLVAYEEIMQAVAQVLAEIKGRKTCELSHSGAAGGIPAGLMACFEQYSVVRGIDLVGRAVRLEEEVRAADLVITGEGCYDLQTKAGKVVSKIKELRGDCIIVCGINKSGESQNVFDLVSRFGEKSISDVEQCLFKVAEELYLTKIRNS